MATAVLLAENKRNNGKSEYMTSSGDIKQKQEKMAVLRAEGSAWGKGHTENSRMKI